MAQVPELASKLPDIMPLSVIENPFQYEDVRLGNVVFELYAKEDIVTQDGQGTTWVCCR